MDKKIKSTLELKSQEVTIPNQININDIMINRQKKHNIFKVKWKNRWTIASIFTPTIVTLCFVFIFTNINTKPISEKNVKEQSEIITPTFTTENNTITAMEYLPFVQGKSSHNKPITKDEGVMGITGVVEETLIYNNNTYIKTNEPINENLIKDKIGLINISKNLYSDVLLNGTEVYSIRNSNDISVKLNNIFYKYALK